MEADEWRWTLDANLTVTYLPVRELGPAMRSASWGRVINLSAGGARVRSHAINHAIYGLVKAAVETLTESLALEFGPEITVNAVAPGQIADRAPDSRR